MREMITFVTVENCMEAISYYCDVFNAEPTGDITMLETITGLDKHKDKVAHATLEFAGSKMFLNDAIDEVQLTQGNNIQLVLDLETEDTLRHVFKVLQNEGETLEELHEVFWGALFGTVKDKYGVIWQLYFGHN